MLVINDLIDYDYTITTKPSHREIHFISHDDEHECKYSLTPEQWERFTRNLAQLGQPK
jgi:hypothetical protein